MFIFAGLLLLTALFINQTKKHQVEAERIMTSLSYPTTPDDKTFDDDKLSLEEYVAKSGIDFGDKFARADLVKKAASLYNVTPRTAQRAIKNINLNK
jgi:hypothetical protein